MHPHNSRYQYINDNYVRQPLTIIEMRKHNDNILQKSNENKYIIKAINSFSTKKMLEDPNDYIQHYELRKDC